MQRVPTGDSLHIKFQVIPTIGFRVIVVGSWVTFWVGFTHPLFTPKKSRFWLGRTWSRPETLLLGKEGVVSRRIGTSKQVVRWRLLLLLNNKKKALGRYRSVGELTSVLLGGAVVAILLTAYYTSRISYWPNKIRYVNYF